MRKIHFLDFWNIRLTWSLIFIYIYSININILQKNSQYYLIFNMGVLPIDTREALHLNELSSRATCYRRGYGFVFPFSARLIDRFQHSEHETNSINRYYRCNSAWNRFGRWILAGVLIFIGLLFFFLIL